MHSVTVNAGTAVWPQLYDLPLDFSSMSFAHTIVRRP